MWRLNATQPEQLAEMLLQGHHPPNNHMRGNASMSALSRRQVLSLSGGAAAAAMSREAVAAIGPNDKFDLVIKGGEVLDPSQSLRAKRDVGIRWGVVEAVD